MTRTLDVRDLGLRAYEPVLALQEELVEARKTGRIGDVLLLVEHEPVFTMGRSADEANITATREELAKRGISVVKTGRGGDVTYHGPGQLVGYPIIHLGEHRLSVQEYVNLLEEAIIRTLNCFGVKGNRDSLNRGVWVGENKVAALGVRVSRRVTMHGFALNVVTDLSGYQGIIPCGIRGRGVTSLSLLSPGVGMESVKPAVVREFRDVFGYGDA